jgi:hypothetical protein
MVVQVPQVKAPPGNEGQVPARPYRPEAAMGCPRRQRGLRSRRCTVPASDTQLQIQLVRSGGRSTGMRPRYSGRRSRLCTSEREAMIWINIAVGSPRFRRGLCHARGEPASNGSEVEEVTAVIWVTAWQFHRRSPPAAFRPNPPCASARAIEDDGTRRLVSGAPARPTRALVGGIGRQLFDPG